MKDYLTDLIGYGTLGVIAAAESWVLHLAGLKGVGNAAATTVVTSILIGMTAKLVDSEQKETE